MQFPNSVALPDPRAKWSRIDRMRRAPACLQERAESRPAERIAEELVSTVAHELKSPLSSLLMTVHLLREQMDGPITARQAELLDITRQESERMLAIVENLLDLSRLKGGLSRPDLQIISASRLLEDAVQRSRSRAEGEGIDLKAEPESSLPDVLADPLRIGLALDNLIANALRHTEIGDKVRVSAHLAAQGVRLTVEDTGEGIASEYLPNLFRRFYRVPGAGRRGSAGLGLAIVREIVAAHGGSVEVESEPSRGSSFSFCLPTATSERS
ncbi:sensor histidine kinase [Singulisphaera sp. PoT]|uniref:sensor histidine kinase n=1 Tax=Singulisphaera sp. PoT TaxID=3411797 RepID=UPI003BF59ECD